jgi:hypothetical protein
MHLRTQPAILCAVSNNKIDAGDLPSITVSNSHSDTHFLSRIILTAAHLRHGDWHAFTVRLRPGVQQKKTGDIHGIT